MRVVLLPDVLAAPVHDLAALGFHALWGRHVVLVPDPEPFLARLGALAEPLRLALDSSVERDAMAPPDAQTIEVHMGPSQWEATPPRLGLPDARRVLDEPLHLWVENADADRAFLLVAVPPELRRELLRQESQGWLAFEHGGGSTLYAQLNVLTEEPRRARRLRSWAMFDGDGLVEGATSGSQKELERLAHRRLHDRVWRLHRRSIESYLPDRALEVWASETGDEDRRQERRRKIAHLRELGRRGWWFNMKHGLAGDQKRLEEERRPDPFADVAGAAREALIAGFGREIAKKYAHPHSPEHPVHRYAVCWRSPSPVSGGTLCDGPLPWPPPRTRYHHDSTYVVPAREPWRSPSH